ncbi:MAG TPA: J domain-containing protein [Terriglobia bacterium]|nr:J domain-containing protein [Terriglobia bacterium]
MPPRKFRFYSLLGLEPGATLEELKRAHRDLVKVWHPDRFNDDPPLQKKAQEKLKEINEAYEQLLPDALSAEADPMPEPQLRPRPFAPEVRWEAGPEAPADLESPVPPQDLHPHGWQRNLIFRAAAALLILVVLAVIVVTVLLNRDMHRSLTTERAQEEPVTSGAPVEAISSDTPAFTVGSTQSEVLSVQGTPTSVEGNRWMYELSSVDFVDGKVDSYANVSRNLRVRLEPQGDVAEERAQGYFAPGSTADAVLAVQGTPTSVQGRRWRFESSYVDFAAGKVESYSNASSNLHVRVDPAGDVTAARARGYFTLGSTPDEVLAVEGTPTSIETGRWTFDASYVGFADGRVDSYANVSQNLHVQILPRGDSSAARERGYFTLGASQDDVLAVQGTPSSVQDNRWSYELSWVKIEDGKVASYSNVSENLRLKMR